MKKSIRQLIKEEVQKVKLSILEESIVNDIMMLVLSPKIKKVVKTIKSDPEFQELERQAKLAKDELEAITKRIERNLDKREKAVAEMKKAGIKVDTSMDSTQMFKAYQDWSKNIDKHVKARGAKSAWEQYFNK